MMVYYVYEADSQAIVFASLDEATAIEVYNKLTKRGKKDYKIASIDANHEGADVFDLLVDEIINKG